MAEETTQDFQHATTTPENGAPRLDPARDTLDGLFWKMASVVPAATALVWNGSALTYGELAARAGGIPAALHKRNIGRGDRVGLCLARCPDQIAAVLGVVRSGAACVPLDPAHPQARTAVILDDAKPGIVITSRELAAQLPAGTPALFVEDIVAADAGDSISTPESAAYILFTSGSTGRPKGVVMPHRALVNLMDWQLRESGGAPRTLQFASLTFDVSFQEIFATLLGGGTLVLIEEVTRRDPRTLLDFIAAQQIERLFLPFVMLQQLAAAAVAANIFSASLREVITAGEALRITPELERFFTALPGCRLQNQYGPTEAHVVTAWTLHGAPETWPLLPPIGFPVQNVRVHLLDETGCIAASGASGELALAGLCLADGYFNQREKTAERFTGITLADGTRERIYRTGDLARFNADGALEYLGRADRQIKISGVRIEPGEVESVIAALPGVKECAVAPFGDGAERRLAAYVVTTPGADFAEAAWREAIAAKLPEPMRPSAWMRLDALPLTPTSKLDRDALPSPARKRPQLAVPFAEPVTPSERKLAALWTDLLALDRAGIDDSLFELGGTSLLVATMQTRVRATLGAEVPVTLFFEKPTIRSLAEWIDGRSAPRRAHKRTSTAQNEPIAIVGMAGRFPGAPDVTAFWKNLRDGVNSISLLRDDELEVPREMWSQPGYVKARALLADVDLFDAEFFGLLPAEAALTDPQHRIFLETAVEALDNASIDPARHDGTTGVFAGLSLNTYLLANIGSDPAMLRELTRNYQSGAYPLLIGNDKDYLATRVAYKLGLRGPAVSVQTGCSTSLVAIVLACRSLRVGECDTALAGGVSVSFPQRRGHFHEEGGMVSPDGLCRPFDADAAGTVFGAGVGIVVLRRLSDALADGDNVLAVIRGVAINNDGADKVSFLAPSVDGQAAVVAAAQAEADIDPATIGYIEAHGTATPLGDPIEIAGLTRAFAERTDKKQFCAIGSAKSNIGHLEAAAGVTGLIKAVLTLQHSEIPPTINYRAPNPRIDFAQTPFRVVDKLLTWPRGETPRRAGVSSFGVGGTNAHVIVEEAPAQPATQPGRPLKLLPVSARTHSALGISSAKLAKHLRDESQPLADVAFTLQQGRREFSERRFVVAANADEAITQLEKADLAPRTLTCTRQNPEVVFLFPGQGAQYAGMATGLLDTEPFFRAAIDECAELAKADLGCDLREVLRCSDAGKLESVAVAQTAIFCVSYSLARLWMRWGVQPAAMLGHSLGEYVAACVAGVWSLEDTLRIVIARARLVESLPQGAMLAVKLFEAELRPRISDGLSVAAVNGPSLCVVSGTENTIAEFENQLAADGVVARRLASKRAFHSAMIDPILPRFRELLGTVKCSAPSMPFWSNLTGAPIRDDEATDPEYWVHHLRETVRFADVVRAVTETPGRVLLEVGPGNGLTQLARQSACAATADVIASLATSGVAANELRALLTALGRLWQNGVEPNWAAFREGEQRRRVPLPSYPFERKRHWIEMREEEIAPVHPSHPERSAARNAGQPERSGGSVADAAESKDPVDLPSASQVIQRDPSTPLRSAQDDARCGLRELFRELSGVDLRASQDELTFIELGFDSLFLTQIRQALQKRFGLKITFRQLLDEIPSIAALAHFAQSQGAVAASTIETETAPTIEPGSPVAAEATASHGPFKPLQKTATELDAAQQRSLNALTARYTRKTAKSKAYAAENRPHFCDPRAAGNFNRTWKEMVYPIVAARSKGGRIWDIDGNEYIDITLGFGVHFLGHNPPYVIETAHRQLDRGTEIGPQSEQAGRVAKMLCEMTGMERATFCNTGSEAVMAAMRAARTATGRNKIAVFAGDYHGMFDAVLVRSVGKGTQRRTLPVAPGIPQSQVDEILVLDYGKPESIDELRAHAGDLAAVLVEPVQARHPDLQPREFLHALRDFTREAGAALIFDEVITGFRCGPGGAQEYFGVRADMATYGKIVGGGMPIGVLAGSREFMDVLDGGQWSYGDDSFPEVGVTFFAGTFVRHPLAMAAAEAVLTHLKNEGPELQRAVSDRAARFVKTINAHFAETGAPMHFENFASILQLKFDDNFRHAGLLFYHLRDRGVFIWEGRLGFLSVAHTDADVDALIEAFRDSAREMRENGLMPLAEGAKVAPLPTREPFPLTSAQREIWMACHLGGEFARTFNESVTVNYSGALDVAALRGAMEEVFSRHETLRTVFADDGTSQTVRKKMSPVWRDEDWSAFDHSEQSRKRAGLADEEAAVEFDLTTGPLLHARFIKLSPTEHLLVLTAHHIVCDGWSLNVIFEDLAEIYSARVERRMPHLDPATPFREFFKWEADLSARPEAAETVEFWRQRFATSAPPLELPCDFPRPRFRRYGGDRVEHDLPPELCRELTKLGAAHGCTLFTVMLTGFFAALHRWTGQCDLVTGIPAAGQSRVDGETLVGHCTNLLPLRMDTRADATFLDFLLAVKSLMLDAYEHQDFTFGRLLETLNFKRDPARAPVVEAAFNLETMKIRHHFAGLDVRYDMNRKRFVQFDLFLNACDYGDRIVAGLEFNTSLFRQATAESMAASYVALLAGGVAEPSRKLADLPLLDDAEMAHLVSLAREPDVEAPDMRGVAEIFAEMAAQHADAVAIAHGDARWSYRELDAWSDAVAARLANDGVQPGEIVGVCIERSAAMIAAWLGIVKAGAAYLPLDPSWPAERRNELLADSGAALVLAGNGSVADFSTRAITLSASVHPQTFNTSHPERSEVSAASETQSKDPAEARATSQVIQRDLPAGISDWKSQAGLLRFSTPLRSGRDDTRLDVATETNADSPIYVIYTSGSTGKPKGVVVRQGAVVRLVRRTNYVALGPDDVIAQASNAAFDAATFEIWGALLNGAQLRIADHADLLDPQRFAALLADAGVTTLFLTTALFNHFARTAPAMFRPLRTLLFGGEACDPGAAREMLANGAPARLLHVYGPTETTTFATWHLVTEVPASAATIPIGRPVAGTEIFILDREQRLMPRGLPGEICIGGDGLALGYLNNAELTAKKFAPHPFREGARVYRSGDFGRMLADGSVEFAGRIDGQVKLRGFRIEPGEIEATLGRHPAVAERCVIVRGSNGAKRLIAYFVPREEVSERALREHLRGHLPDFMIPAAFVRMDALPTNANGKVDAARLPDPAFAAHDETDKAAPSSQTEHFLVETWERLLGRKGIGIDDDFFELGGHSLLALQMAVEVGRRSGNAFPVGLLFRAPTIRELAVAVDGHTSPRAGTSKPSTLIPIQPEGARPPVFFVHAGDGGVLFYRDIAQMLGPDQPSYGIEAPWLTGGETTHTTIEAIAAYYISQIRAERPAGPYLLAGFSFGGIAVYEMARQLREAGEEVPLLCVFDTYNPDRPPRRLSVAERVETQRRALSGKGVGARIAHLAERASSKLAVTWLVQKERMEMAAAHAFRAAGRPLPARMRMAQARKAHLDALDFYHPQPAPGGMLLFTAQTRGDGFAYDDDLGWGELPGDKLRVVSVPGSHDTILLQPNVGKVGDALRAELDRLAKEADARR